MGDGLFEVDLLLKTFCTEEDILLYFSKFSKSLNSVDNLISKDDVLVFKKILQFVERTNLLHVGISNGKNMSTDSNLQLDFVGKLSEQLCNALDNFTKYLFTFFNKSLNDEISSHPFQIEIICEIIILLLNILVEKTKEKNFIDALVKKLCSYNTLSNNKLNQLIDGHDVPMRLKLLSDVLHCIPETDGKSYITNEILLIVLDELQNFDYKSLNFFATHIFQKIMLISETDSKRKILETLWKITYENFDDNSENLAAERKSCTYTMFCCLSQNIFISGWKEVYYPLHKEAKFWEIVQFGLSDCHPFTRKRALFIFKQFLDWARLSLPSVIVDDSVPIFSLNHPDFSISSVWRDVIALLEVLEENQVHVIKPLLPKFENMIKLAKSKACLESRDAVVLHTSWVVFLAKRMLQHENPFIVKWTLLCGLNLNFRDCPIQQHNTFELFIKIMVEAINDQALFARSEDSADTLTEKKIATFFKNCILALNFPKEKVKFVRTLLEVIAQQSWCGVALLHVSCALSQLGQYQAWSQEDLSHIRKLILAAHCTQEPIIRGAIQCYMLESCLNLIDWANITFDDLSELLSVFKSKESFVRHSAQWNNLVAKLKEVFLLKTDRMITRKNARKFCEEHVKRVHGTTELDDSDFSVLEKTELEKISRMLMILADSGIICEDSCTCNPALECLYWFTLLKPVVNVIFSAPQRPYLPMQKFTNSLQFYLYLFQSCSVSGCPTDPHRASLIKYLEGCSEVVLFIFQNIFKEISSIEDIAKLDILFNALSDLFNESELQVYFSYIMPICIDQCRSVLENTPLLKSMFAQFWMSLGWICKFFSSVSIENNSYSHKYLKKMVEDIINKGLLKLTFPKLDFINDSIAKDQWVKIVNRSICEAWNIVTYGIKHFDFDERMIKHAVDAAICALNTSPQCAVISIIECLKLLIPKLSHSNPDFISSVFDLSWKTCTELRFNETFRPTLKVFITMIFQRETMNSKFAPILSKYVKELVDLSENSIGIFNFLMEHLCYNFNVKSLKLLWEDFILPYTTAMVFSPVHRKDQKIIEDTINLIIEQGEALAVNKLLQDTHKPDAMVRVIAINSILKSLHIHNEQNEKLIFDVIKSLLNRGNIAIRSRSVKFSNSYSHRLNNRVWQVILLLQPYLLSYESCEQLLAMVIEHLVMENQQPSISYLQEWVAIRILYTNSKLLTFFIQNIDTNTEKRLGSATSFLSILFHLMKLEVIDSEKSVLECFPFILRFCMAQNFNVRLHAYLALKSMWTLCENKRFSSVLEKYDFVKRLISPQDPASDYGNFTKNFQKLSDDFYFTTFNPVTHYTFETIFYELPRLSRLTSDEWIHPTLFEKENTHSSFMCLPYFNCDDKLKESSPTIWSNRVPVVTDVSESDSVDFNFQKKIMPWKDMLISSENFNENVQSRKKVDIKDGLIVVASLIDKLPNLGGLCRTCEIFGVQEYIIESIKYTEDKQFQSLAVTADKWVNIREVKQYKLKEYLTMMKKGGYTIIGVEQTDDSRMLGDYVFQKKTVLLLGDEKKGIPVDLIQMMDTCIEIPQQGIVRSLNVHVSGAILIWEYARQHLNCPSLTNETLVKITNGELTNGETL